MLIAAYYSDIEVYLDFYEAKEGRGGENIFTSVYGPLSVHKLPSAFCSLPILTPCSRMNELKIISVFRLKQKIQYLSYKSLMLCLKVNILDFEDVKAK